MRRPCFRHKCRLPPISVRVTRKQIPQRNPRAGPPHSGYSAESRPVGPAVCVSGCAPAEPELCSDLPTISLKTNFAFGADLPFKGGAVKGYLVRKSRHIKNPCKLAVIAYPLQPSATF